MNKILKTAAFFVLAGVIITPLAFAQGTGTLGEGTPLNNISDNITNFDSLIKLLLRLAVAAAILWTLFNLIKAGIQYTGAGADAGKKKEALGSVISAVVGLVIVLLSLVILYFVGGFIGVNPDSAVGAVKDFGPCSDPGNTARRGIKVRVDGNNKEVNTGGGLKCKIPKEDGTSDYILLK